MVISNSYGNERGVALVISLMFVAILALLGTTAYVLTTTDMQIGSNYKTSLQAFWDTEAGANYGLALMEAGLKASPAATFTLPTAVGDPTDPNDSNSVPLPSFTMPSGFGFSFRDPGLTMITDNPLDTQDIYTFTTDGTSTNNSNATITVTLKRLPAIKFGAFGDNKMEMKNDAKIYSYSYTTTPNPTPADSTGEGDCGSNTSVILNNNAVVNGDSALGQDAGGNDASLTDHGGVVSGTNGAILGDRVDPDPLGVIGGEYASKFITVAGSNDNSDASLVLSNSGDSIVSNIISLGSSEDLTLKGKAGGANYYISSISVGNKSVLYIDTTNGPVNIYLTGALTMNTGSELMNTTGCGAVACSHCIWTPSLDCSACPTGAPSNFSVFSNSNSNIGIKNSVTFSGLIYAPYAQIRFSNSATIYGALWGNDVEIVASATIYFDTDMKDKLGSKDLALSSWKDVLN
jgi:hypothetical protein